MRRLVALPVKSCAITAILLTGALYVAAEARQTVIRRQQLELARLESTVVIPTGDGTGTLLASEKQAIGASAEGIPPDSRLSTPVASASTGPQARIPAQLPATDRNGHIRQIVISIPDRQLALLEDGKLVKTYPIAVGTPFSPSPEGDFTIINHAKDPVYRHKGKEIQPGKDNPLGTRWLGLSLKGYGIHGTNVPRSIGKAASHGCFRMAKEDVEDLYSRVRVGDSVKVRRQHDEQIATIFATPDRTPGPAVAGAEVQVASTASTDSTPAPATSTVQ